MAHEGAFNGSQHDKLAAQGDHEYGVVMECGLG